MKSGINPVDFVALFNLELSFGITRLDICP